MSRDNFLRVNDDNANYLSPSSLKIMGTNGVMVKLYRFVGSTAGVDWGNVKEYFMYVTPEFVLREGVTGFKDYGDIGWYCKHKDVFIVEERLDVPVHLSIGYQERLRRNEAGEWYDCMTQQQKNHETSISEIKSWFTEAVYPENVRDYLSDIIMSSRIYLPGGRSNFFDEGGICFIIREDQDFIGMFVNLEFSKRLANCTGVLDGIFCYLDFNVELADSINDNCVDNTDEFRELFVKAREDYVYHHEPKHFHKFHSGCTKKFPKYERIYPMSRYDKPHY